MKFELEEYASLPSTNLFLLESETPIHGRAVLALDQPAGIGRRGRSWLSAQGALALSFGLEIPSSEQQILPWLPVWLGIAAFDVAQTLTSDSLTLKWPNDMYLSGRKVAGILSQARANAEVTRIALGIGMNLQASPPGVPQAIGLGSQCHPRDFAKALIARLETSDFRNSLDLKIAWEKRCQHISRTVVFGDPATPLSRWQTGIAIGLTSTAALTVELENGERRDLLAEEVSLRF